MEEQYNYGPDPQGPLFLLGIVVAAISIPSYFSDTAQLSFALLLFPLLILLALVFFSESDGESAEEYHNRSNGFINTPTYNHNSSSSSSSYYYGSSPYPSASPSSAVSFTWLVRYSPLLFFFFFFFPWGVACFLFLYLFISMAK